MGFLHDDRNFLLAWFISGGFTILMPLFMFMVARVSNSAQDGNENNGNNNNNNNEDQGCSWWQWRCGDGEEAQRDENYSAPWWWFGGGEDQPEDEGANGSLVFIYLWSLILFGLILYYGADAVRNGRDTAAIVALALFANMCFLALFFLGGLEGAIETEGRAIEEDGWYGQFGVLMYMTNLFWMLFSIAFAFIIRSRTSSKNVTQIEVDPADYHICGDLKYTA